MRERERISIRMQTCTPATRAPAHVHQCTAHEAADPKAVDEDVVESLAAREELSDHIQVGAHRPGSGQHGLDTHTRTHARTHSHAHTHKHACAHTHARTHVYTHPHNIRTQT